MCEYRSSSVLPSTLTLTLTLTQVDRGCETETAWALAVTPAGAELGSREGEEVDDDAQGGDDVGVAAREEDSELSVGSEVWHAASRVRAPR